MEHLFHKILVPVDFSFRSVKAVEKALVTAAAYRCSVTLLHTVPLHPFAAIAVTEGHTLIPYELIDNRAEIEYQLVKMADRVLKRIATPVPIHLRVTRGSWDDAVIDCIKREQIDCVIVGQRSRFHRKRKLFLNPDKIAASTHIPVITVPLNKSLLAIKSIVIPVTDFLPKRKLMYGMYLASQSNATIELLGIDHSSHQPQHQSFLLKAYSILTEEYGLKTTMSTVEGKSTAKAVYDYTQTHNTDLVVLNPGVQTIMPGWWSSLFTNIIQKYSGPSVLTVTPV
jgi:nucleotide-binding universal stress UspA family protein